MPSYTVSFDPQVVVPTRRDLACTVDVPDDWRVSRIGASSADHVTDADAMPAAEAPSSSLKPLLRAESPDASIRFVVMAAVLPLADLASQSLHDLAVFLLEREGWHPRTLDAQQVGSLMGIGAELSVGSPLSPSTVRVAFCEDGGRLVQLVSTAPGQSTALPRVAWTRALESFAFLDHRGSTLDCALPVDDWWHRALTLERSDRLSEAEALLRNKIPHLAFAAQTAELYAHRMRRLRTSGDLAGAAQAFAKAEEWIRFYAGLATSGGEGAALSVERDEFLAALGASHDA